MKLTKTHALVGVAALAAGWYFFLRSPSATATCTGVSVLGAPLPDATGHVPVKFHFSDGTSAVVSIHTGPGAIATYLPAIGDAAQGKTFATIAAAAAAS